jgi:predicted secreted Zn-dependent protease
MTSRSSLLALALLAVATTGQAAHAQEVEAPEIGWACQLAFEAAAAVESAQAESGAGAAVADAAAAQRDPAADVTRLDDAVRMCVSPEEWAAGAAAYPDAFGDVDPMEHFAGRCSDAEARLAVYTACHDYLLAQAAPTDDDPRVGIVPLVVPRSALSDQEPVPLPQPMKAYVPGATRERWFEVEGNSVDALLAMTQAEAGRFCGGSDTLACTKNGWRGSWRKGTSQRTGACVVRRFTPTLRATVFMPRWAGPAQVHPDVLTWWRGFLHRAAWHEGQHIEIQRVRLAELEEQLEGEPCRQARGIIRRWEKGTSQAHRAFDASEQERGLPLRPEYWLRP